MSKLEDVLIEYTEVTIELINCDDSLDKIQQLVEKRENKLEELKLIKCTDIEKQELINKFKLLELEKKAEDKIKMELKKTKDSINNVRKIREARKSFIKQEGTPTFFDSKG